MVISKRQSKGLRSRITSQGQITVPKAVRDQLGAKPGDELEFDPGPGGMVIRLRPRTSILAFAGVADSAATRIPASAEAMDDALERAGIERALVREAKFRAATSSSRRRRT
jgi:AbrB family looped-hinge helix DNA binding protein